MSSLPLKHRAQSKRRLYVCANFRPQFEHGRLARAGSGRSRVRTSGPSATALTSAGFIPAGWTRCRCARAYVSPAPRVIGPASILWQRKFASEIFGSAGDVEFQADFQPIIQLSTAAGICTGAAAQKCTTGSVVACPRSPWEGPARGATRPRRGWRRPARGRGLWAHGVKRGVIRTVAGVVTGSA